MQSGQEFARRVESHSDAGFAEQDHVDHSRSGNVENLRNF